jgi:hypothetical protein
MAQSSWACQNLCVQQQYRSCSLAESGDTWSGAPQLALQVNTGSNNMTPSIAPVQILAQALLKQQLPVVF